MGRQVGVGVWHCISKYQPIESRRAAGFEKMEQNTACDQRGFFI